MKHSQSEAICIYIYVIMHEKYVYVCIYIYISHYLTRTCTRTYDMLPPARCALAAGLEFEGRDMTDPRRVKFRSYIRFRV